MLIGLILTAVFFLESAANFGRNYNFYELEGEDSEIPEQDFSSRVVRTSRRAPSPSIDHGKRLLGHLLRGYDPNIRPTLEYNQPVNVTIGLNLYQLLTVNERDENVLLYMWTKQLWDDVYLGWDPADYGGINWTTLPYRRLWLPDTFVYNSIHTKNRYINIMATTSAIDKGAKGKFKKS